MANKRITPLGYHGVSNVKFAQKEEAAYATEFIELSGAKSLNHTSLLEDTEVYGDNRLLLRVPNDKGYTTEIGVNAPIPELEKAAGYAIEGANGLIGANVAQYLSGALYYEFIEIGQDKRPRAVKVWLYSVELGKSAPTHTSDAKSIELGEYKYPCTVSGDPLMDDKGVKPYIDELGMGRMAFMYYARPGDEGYDTFGDTVPTPKVKAVPPPVGI